MEDTRYVCSERWKRKGKRDRGKEKGRKNKYRMESVSWRACQRGTELRVAASVGTDLCIHLFRDYSAACSARS